MPFSHELANVIAVYNTDALNSKILNFLVKEVKVYNETNKYITNISFQI